MVEKLKQDRARRLARRGDGAARRPVELRIRAGGRLEATEAAEPKSRCARPPESARRHGARPRRVRRTCRAAGSSRTIRSTKSCSTRRRARRTSAGCADCRPGWRTNDIGARLMAAIAAAKPLERRRVARPRAEAAGADQGCGAGQRPAQAAAQDPCQGDRCRGAADRPFGRPRGARRGRPQEPQHPRTAGGIEQFGRDALDLVEGRLAFAIENGKLKMSRVAEVERVDA